MSFRIIALTGFPAVGIVMACGEVLPIGGSDPTTADGGSVPDNDASPDALSDGGSLGLTDANLPPIQGATCDPGQCRAVGGSCLDGACTVFCTDKTCGKNTTFTCPAGNDCQLVCQTSCEEVSCVGGKSCRFVCATKDACKSVACEGESCAFLCREPGTCKDATCNAPNCTFQCNGDGSCPADLTAESATTCLIDCNGAQSCKGPKDGNAAHLECGAARASKIVCSGANACGNAVPRCNPGIGSSCELSCNGPNACAAGVCCSGISASCVSSLLNTAGGCLQ